MNNEHVIDINPDGSVESLYNDTVGVGDIGKASMRRASHIVFNEDTQLWDIHPVGVPDIVKLPEPYSGWGSYERAIEFEVLLFNEARIAGVATPEGLMSDRGVEIAEAIAEFLAAIG